MLFSAVGCNAIIQFTLHSHGSPRLYLVSFVFYRSPSHSSAPDTPLLLGEQDRTPHVDARSRALSVRRSRIEMFWAVGWLMRWFCGLDWRIAIPLSEWWLVSPVAAADRRPHVCLFRRCGRDKMREWAAHSDCSTPWPHSSDRPLLRQAPVFINTANSRRCDVVKQLPRNGSHHDARKLLFGCMLIKLWRLTVICETLENRSS